VDNLEDRYHDNVKSHVFHAPGCHYDCKNYVQGFVSYDDAIRAGYRPYKQCIEVYLECYFFVIEIFANSYDEYCSNDVDLLHGCQHLRLCHNDD